MNLEELKTAIGHLQLDLSGNWGWDYKPRLEELINLLVFELESIHVDRQIYNFGTDCTWINFRTKEKTNIWDRCMRIITEEESKSLVREYNLEKLGI